MMCCGLAEPSAPPWMPCLHFGRPEKIELLVLVDRRYSSHIPVSADYVGIEVDSIASQRVVVSWKETDGEDKVVLAF